MRTERRRRYKHNKINMGNKYGEATFVTPERRYQKINVIKAL